jgi:hypothetical protein
MTFIDKYDKLKVLNKYFNAWFNYTARQNTPLQQSDLYSGIILN